MFMVIYVGLYTKNENCDGVDKPSNNINMLVMCPTAGKCYCQTGERISPLVARSPCHDKNNRGKQMQI